MFYTYARTLYDTSLSAEEIAKDYFETAFGEAADQFYTYLKKVGEAFDFYYLEGERSAEKEISPYYNPERAKALEAFGEIVKEGRALIDAHYNYSYRLGTASVRLLEYHLEFAEGMAKALAAKAVGKDEEAQDLYDALRIEFGKKEIYIEKYYDHFNFCYAYNSIFRTKSKLTEPIIAATE